MNRVLIVVDMQNDFVNGTLGTKEAVNIVPNVVDKINQFNGIIAVTQDTHDSDYFTTQEGQKLPVQHCLKQTNGWELCIPVFKAICRHANVYEQDTKYYYKSAFGSIELANWLASENDINPIDEVTVVGLCTDICVISNVLLIKAFLPDVTITVDAACCAGVTPESHNRALAAMKMCQINIENWES